MPSRKKKVLITGGAGFIASHITDAYIAQGYSVVVIDDLSTGFRRNVNPKAKFYKTDIRDLAKLRKIFAAEKPTIVNHHAAIVEVIKSVRDPLPTMRVNVEGTINLLLCAGESKVKRFIFASTGGAIYGEPKKLPADETTPTQPLSPYGLSKLLAEHAIDFYARTNNFNYVILRYPNVYGPRQNPKGEAGVVAIFGGLMKSGKRPIIFGDGSKSRDYVFVGDIVRANVLALKKGRNDIVNLGWAKTVSDQNIFDTTARHAKFLHKPVYAPYRKGEVYKISLKPLKAKKILSWQPKIDLSTGIKKTLETIK